ncbi:hypothetical protein PGT21_013975 [Puccinia graminis f. sp. tritici]|uniref:CBM1 domain-containing protein n=1 Tax=Puccinia graminis f. sp. tritici TaxID=56615 RepID=A0A5B0QXA3_PUCGR|nr:hypothetical protein PGTUg99_008568 [Puccinia graminis f. sp. tritici]KAA1117543.1 hypothetical protein PGT21_013975 [Puccinia graminis f. sp. tritici]
MHKFHAILSLLTLLLVMGVAVGLTGRRSAGDFIGTSDAACYGSAVNPNSCGGRGEFYGNHGCKQKEGCRGGGGRTSRNTHPTK